jgi:hypothetical protein
MNEQDRRLKRDIVASEASLKAQLATAQRPVVVRNFDSLTRPAAIAGATILGLALITGGRFGGGSEPTGSFSPTTTPAGETATTRVSEAPGTPNLSDGGLPSFKLATPGQTQVETGNQSNLSLLPSNLNAVPVDGTFPQGRWFYPIYDQAEANAADNWRGIGPHFPVGWLNVDANAAQLSASDQNVGTLNLMGVDGGRVVVGLYVPALYRTQAEYANGVQDTHGGLQYTIDGLPVGTQVGFIDPHTGGPLAWPDGTPVVYEPNDSGTLSLQVPDDANDSAILMTFVMPGQQSGVQVPEVIIRRGSNNHPELRGENPLPSGVEIPAITALKLDELHVIV